MRKYQFNLIAIICFILITASIYSTNAFGKKPARVIAGWVEKVIIENQEFEVKAKLDTGAQTSSIHAINIKPYKKNKERRVEFTLVLNDSKDNIHELKLDKPRSRKSLIKNHNGEHDKRYVVDLEICFNGRKHITEFNLTNRDEFIYDVLLGRKFLQETAIIDSDKTFLTLASCQLESNK